MQTASAEGEVLLLTHDPMLRDAVSSAAAALDQPVRAVGPGELGGLWRSAAVVFVGQERAPEVAELGLAVRDGIYLLGSDPDELGRWSMPLGASVVVLPDGRSWLSSILARGAGRGRAPVITVLAGSGGLGASTLAVALACRAARRRLRVVVVDLDPHGGGIDLLLGAERVPGWRWPRLSSAEGFLADLAPFLPNVDGVDVLSMARGSSGDVAKEPLAAVIGSLQRSHDLVILDPGRSPSPATRDSVRLSTRLLLLVGSAVRSVAAAQQLADTLELADARLVVRRVVAGSVPDEAVADTLELPLAGALAEDPVVRRAAENGDSPADLGRRYSATCERLLDDVLGAGAA